MVRLAGLLLTASCAFIASRPCGSRRAVRLSAMSDEDLKAR